MLTLGDIRAQIAPLVDGGVCLDSPRIAQVVTEAVARLAAKPAAARYTVRTVRLWSNGGTLVLPRELRKIIKVRVEGQTAQAYSKWFEFADSGPGYFADASSLSGQDLVDRGETCLQFSIPRKLNGTVLTAGFRLLVFSDQPEADSANLDVRGLTPDGRMARTESWAAGELVPLRNTFGVYTQNEFWDVTGVRKPRTNGYVFVEAYNPDTFERFHLATYHPAETNPSYRQYALKGLDFSADTEPLARSVLALAQCQALPLVLDTDPLLIENIPAIGTMCQAISLYRLNDAKGGSTFEALAERQLQEDFSSYVGDASEGMDIQMAASVFQPRRNPML